MYYDLYLSYVYIMKFYPVSVTYVYIMIQTVYTYCDNQHFEGQVLYERNCEVKLLQICFDNVF